MARKKTKVKLTDDGRRVIATNKRARREFHIEDLFEAGLVLKGSEVKSLRGGRINLADGYIRMRGGEAFLVDVHVPPYKEANINNHEPTRARKLLLHKRELNRLAGKVAQHGYTLVPLQLYFREGRAKLEFGLGKGKKLHDKREDSKKADATREIARAMRRR